MNAVLFYQMELTQTNRVLLIVIFTSFATFFSSVAQSDKAEEILRQKFDDFEKKFNKHYKNKEERDHRLVNNKDRRVGVIQCQNSPRHIELQPPHCAL